MKDIEYLTVLKENVLKLASEHKASCKNPNCSISLMLVGTLLEKAGVELTKAELSALI